MFKKILISSLILLNGSMILGKVEPKKTEGLPAKSDSKRKKIQQLVSLMNDSDAMEKSMKALAPQIREPLFKEIKDKKLQEEINKSIDKYLNNFVHDFKSTAIQNQFIKLWDDIYTEKEIEGLLEFYKSSLGKKTLIKLPEILSLSTAISNNIAQKHLGAFSKEIEDIKKKAKK